MGSITKAELAAQVEASRKSLARERAKAARLQKTLAETQQREAATREILRVISASPSDAQPVFEAIVAQRGPPLRRGVQRGGADRRTACSTSSR